MDIEFSKNKGLSPVTTSTPLLAAFPGNDDEKERRQRRRSRVIDLQTAAGTPAAVPKLSNAQISEHYSTCIKLSTENKITTKNAFGLHLIDYMADILKQKDSELTNFKVAAGTLDASTKIYAVRVDAVHADAYRVLGGLGAETKPGEGKEGEPIVKQVKKKRPPKKTVEQNLSNINAPESERRCEVDPMFHKMASSFDESSTAGVFLSVLFSESSRCELLFPSHMILLQSKPSYSPPPPQSAPASPFMGKNTSEEKSAICPSLQDFSFTSWNPEQTMNQLLEKMKQGEHVFDVNAEPEPEHEEDDCPDFDADFEEGQGDYDDGLKEYKDGCEATGSGRGRDVIPIGEGDIATMCLQLTMAAWAGPGYWQFKPKHKLDHMPDKEKPKRNPKNWMCFLNAVQFYIVSSQAATTISNRRSLPAQRNTLPADFQFPQRRCPSSASNPPAQKRLSGELGEGIGDYDYNNANDTVNFCPGLAGGDSDDDAEGFASDDTQPSGTVFRLLHKNWPTFYGVNKIEINYAKTAKKMDMKRLKNSMWTLLTDSPEKSKETVEKPEVCGEKAFTQTTKSLLQRLPNTMAQNLSVPLAFVALLHLANEKNLELVKVDDMSDIIIRQGR
uniref:Condensin complex subunit 2 n=1 Tax=Neogobius melanostomus TaxID=47308 RepID=A0A8C6SKK5_9GOBI